MNTKPSLRTGFAGVCAHAVAAGWGGVPLVGTADRIVEELQKFTGIGLDGILLSWVDYLEGLDDWQREVMPRLEQAGMRRPLHPGA